MPISVAIKSSRTMDVDTCVPVKVRTVTRQGRAEVRKGRGFFLIFPPRYGHLMSSNSAVNWLLRLSAFISQLKSDARILGASRRDGQVLLRMS